jgi:hypothetical protein
MKVYPVLRSATGRATAESELERLKSQKAARATVVTMPLQLDQRLHRLVADLEIEPARDVQKARTILRQLIGNEVPVVPHASGKHLVARVGLDVTELLQAVGAHGNFAPEILMVAGAGFEPATFGL